MKKLKHDNDIGITGITRDKKSDPAIPAKLIFIYLAVLSLYLSMQSHFMPFSDFNLGHDAGIFAYIGWGMKRGRVLYTQLWENKGPLLYILNFFGVLINERFGIFILEFAAIFIATIFAYKTARFFAGIIVSAASVTYTFLILALLLERGNLSEEYALPFICAGIYILTHFFFQDYSLRRHQCFAAGAMFAGAFLLRANLVAAFAAFGIIIILVMLFRMRIIELVRYGLLVITGMLTAAIPAAIYLYINNALKACLDSAYLGIMSGFNPPSLQKRISVTVRMMSKLNNSHVLIIFIALTAICAFLIIKNIIVCAKAGKKAGIRTCDRPGERTDTKKRAGFDEDAVVASTGYNAVGEGSNTNSKGTTAPRLLLLASTAIGLILNTYVNSISGVYHPHYYMSFIPLITIPAVIFWDGVRWIAEKALCGLSFVKGIGRADIGSAGRSPVHKIKALPHFCTIIIASALSLLLSWNNIAANNKIVLSSLQKASEIGNTRAQRLSDYVVENTGPDDEVYFLTYSGASTVLYRAKRLAASRYSYLPINLESFSENRKTEMVREVIADLMKNPPELLIVDTKWYVSLLDYLDNLDNRQRWEEFVAGNYNEVHSIDEFKMMKRNVP